MVDPAGSVDENGNVQADPNSDLDYTWDWSSWLPAGDTIATATVTAPEGEASVTRTAHDATTVTAFVRPTAPVYSSIDVVCHIVTVGGRADDRTITLTVKER